MVKRRSRNLKMTVEQRLTYNAGSWRSACHVSDPYDTFPSHLWLTGRINASESRFYSLTHQLRCSLLLPIFVHSELFAYRQKKERERYIPSSTVHYPRHLHPNLHGPCKLIREHPSLYSSYFLCFISCLMVVVLLRCCFRWLSFPTKLGDGINWDGMRWELEVDDDDRISGGASTPLHFGHPRYSIIMLQNPCACPSFFDPPLRSSSC